MPPKKPHEETTKTLVREALSSIKAHEYEPQEARSNWFNSEMLKIVGVVVSFLTPIVVSLVLWCGETNTKIALLEEQKNVTIEVRSDIKAIKDDVMSIKIQLARDAKDTSVAGVQ
jgi:hypothetical protein